MTGICFIHVQNDLFNDGGDVVVALRMSFQIALLLQLQTSAKQWFRGDYFLSSPRAEECHSSSCNHYKVDTLEPIKTDTLIADAEINDAGIPNGISSVFLGLILSIFLGAMTSSEELAPRKDGVMKDGDISEADGRNELSCWR